MGKISILTQGQKQILDRISRSEYLRNRFYFTGGTALSEFYLQHRYSDDLDFFSEKEYDQEIIFTQVSKWASELDFEFTSRFAEVVYRFNINFPHKESFIVDFGYYPHRRIGEAIKYKSLEVDSILDIATNKLLTINQRSDIKDFVDLYFLTKDRFTTWDLIYGVEAKFKRFKLDILLLSEDFLKIDDFTSLPKMIKPLKLATLKQFFRQKAKQLGRKAVVK